MKINTNFNVKSHLTKQVVSAIPSCVTSLCSGMTFGMTSGMLPQLRADQNIHYNPTHESWIACSEFYQTPCLVELCSQSRVAAAIAATLDWLQTKELLKASISALSMVLGSLCCGPILDRYGRKVAHIFLGIPYIIGWMAISCAPSTNIIILGRFITGLSSGANRAVTLVYIGELASPSVRGYILIIPNILMSAGVLLTHLLGYYSHWRINAATCIIPSVSILITSLFLKESPLWLISKGRTEEGIRNFRWFRGTDKASEAELKTVLEKQLKTPESSSKAMLKIVCSGSFIKPMLILLLVMVNIKFSGLAVLMFYSQDIFEQMFSGHLDPIIMIVVMDCVSGVISVSLCFIGKYVSKKKTYCISNFGVFLCAAGIVSFLIIGDDRFLGISLTCMVLFFCFATVIFNNGWTFVPELLPSSARGLGSGLNMAFSSIPLFLVLKIAPAYLKSQGPAALFIFFGVSTLVFGFILCFLLPETDGRTLQSIEDSYNSKKAEPVDDEFENKI